MLLRWLKRLEGAIRSLRNPSRRPRHARPRPLRLEALETRLVPATTLIWTGAAHHNLWSQAANWAASGGPDKKPGAGDTLIFPDGAKQLSNRNDIPHLTLALIQFTGASGGYDLSGNGISLTGGITAGSSTMPSSGMDTVEFPITITQAQGCSVAAGLTLALNGGVGTSVSSGGSWTLNGAGTVALGGTSAFESNVDVRSGALQVNGSLAENQGGLNVEHEATLTDAGSVTVATTGEVDDDGTITVAAAGPNGQAAGAWSSQGFFTVENDGTLTDAGSVTVEAQTGLSDFGDVTICPGGTLTDQANITVEQGASLEDAGTLTIQQGPASRAPAALEDAGVLRVESGGVLNDGGTLTVDFVGTLTDAGAVNVGFKDSKNILHSGTLNDFGQLSVEGADANAQAAGFLQVSGAGSTLTVDLVGTLTDAGDVHVNKAGALDDWNLVTVRPGGNLLDASVVTVESFATLDDGGAVSVEGGPTSTATGFLRSKPAIWWTSRAPSFWRERPCSPRS
jgi:hypothetical protein